MPWSDSLIQKVTARVEDQQCRSRGLCPARVDVWSKGCGGSGSAEASVEGKVEQEGDRSDHGPSDIVGHGDAVMDAGVRE